MGGLWSLIQILERSRYQSTCLLSHTYTSPGCDDLPIHSVTKPPDNRIWAVLVIGDAHGLFSLLSIVRCRSTNEKTVRVFKAFETIEILSRR
jgi:hypothetical protein